RRVPLPRRTPPSRSIAETHCPGGSAAQASLRARPHRHLPNAKDTETPMTAIAPTKSKELRQARLPIRPVRAVAILAAAVLIVMGSYLARGVGQPAAVPAAVPADVLAVDPPVGAPPLVNGTAASLTQ